MRTKSAISNTIYLVLSISSSSVILLYWIALGFGNAFGSGSNKVWYMSPWGVSTTLLVLNVIIFFTFKNRVNKKLYGVQSTVVLIALLFIGYLFIN